MKQFIIIIGIVVIAMITSLTLLSQESLADRQDELNRATSAAAKQTVKTSQLQKQRDITSNEKMAIYFAATLSSNIKSDGKINIKIISADYKEGLIDVIVTETFQYPNGKTAKIKVRKCAIYG